MAQKSCPGACSGCTLGQAREGVAEWSAAHSGAAGQTELRGWALLWRSACAFVLPLLLALAGALLAGAGETRRFAGLSLGLLVGMPAGMMLNRLLQRMNGPANPKEPE